MSDVVDLHPAERLEDNLEFVSDCCRFSENVMSEEAVRKKWKFSNTTWRALAKNEALIEAIELEKVRRIRSGQQKRERAQVLVTNAPDVLAEIMNAGSDVSPRHRIDSAKTLSEFAQNPGDRVPAADRFQIILNLGADVNGNAIVERFDKSIKPLAAGERDPDDPDDVDTGMLAAIAMKPTEGGGGGDNTL
jgi:hypothetical protein